MNNIRALTSLEKPKKNSVWSWMLTWPHTSSPNPINTHHIHWSSCRGEQLNGFPPNWTITIYKGKQRKKGVNIFRGKIPKQNTHIQKIPNPTKKPPTTLSHILLENLFCLSTYYSSAGLIQTYFISRIIKLMINNLLFGGLNLKSIQNESSILYSEYVTWRS